MAGLVILVCAAVAGVWALMWLAAEGMLQMAIGVALTSPCAKSATEYPSPDGDLVAISFYIDCIGATGSGGRSVEIRLASDTRWLRMKRLLGTSEKVVIRSVHWRDERTVVVTTDYPLKYGTNHEGETPYGVRLVHEYELPFPTPHPTRTPRAIPSPAG